MKTATLRIQCHNSNKAYAVVAQLNRLAAHRTDAIPFTKFLGAASKEGTTGIAVKLTNCTKKETVTILRDILTYYKCFGATGQAYCTNPLTKCEIKIVSLPFKEDTDISEELKLVNELCKAKFKPEDLLIY